MSPDTLLRPSLWPVWLGIGLLWLLHWLPLPLQAAIGNALGWLLALLLRKRRHIVATNLALCFPDAPKALRRRWLRQTFQASVRAVLEHVLTDEAFERMIALAEGLARRVRAVIASHGLPWYVAQMGSRVETMYAPDAPRDAADVARGRNGVLESLLHVYFMNHGVVITPFHSMLLMCPATGPADADRYVEVLEAFCSELVARCSTGVPA